MASLRLRGIRVPFLIFLAVLSVKFFFVACQHASVQQTLGIIKPDAFASRELIMERIKKNGFMIKQKKEMNLTKERAEQFYVEHKDKPFYSDLTTYMSSGPLVVMELEKVNAVQDWRKLMGATNPEKADSGTLRKEFGTSIEKNAVHGSDSAESASKELKFFFN